MRLRLLKFHFLLLSLVALARLDAQTCTGYLAGLSAGEAKAAEVATKTFADLIDTVKNPAAKAAWIAEMVARQDPFAAPDGADLLVPLKHLEAFRRMLESIGYTPESMRELLLPVVEQYQAHRDRSEQEQAGTLKENFNAITVQTPERRGAALSPDGRFLTSLHDERFWVVDGEKGQIFDGPLGFDGAALHFSADNKTAYVGYGKELTIYRRDGQTFTLEKSVTVKQNWFEHRVSGREKTFAFGHPIPLANPRWVITEFRYGGFVNRSRPGLWLVDVNTGATKRVNGTHKVQATSGHGGYGTNWTVAPGTNRLIIREPNGSGSSRLKFLYGDIEENGQVKQWHTTGPGDGPYQSNPNLWASRDYVAVGLWDANSSLIIQPLNGKPLTVYTDAKGHRPSNVLFHPDGKTAFADFHGRLHQIDLESGKVTGILEAPLRSWLSPDGERLFSIPDGTTFINAPYKHKIKPPPVP